VRRDLLGFLVGALVGTLAASTGVMLAAGLAGRSLGGQEKAALLWARNLDRYGAAALIVGAVAGGVAGVAARRRADRTTSTP
jgi:outer membrane lipoprotein SlyB